MSDNKNGKFCNSCQKNVIDFTILSEHQIYSIIEQANGEICGRLSEHQLNKVMLPVTASSYAVRPVPYAILAGLLLISAISTAETKKPLENIVMFSPFNNHVNNSKFGMVKADTTTRKLDGIIFDAENKQPMPGCSVTIKGTAIRSMCNYYGKFELKIPLKLARKNIVLQVNSVGYKSQEIEIPKKDLLSGKSLTISMDIAIGFLGGISVIMEPNTDLTKENLIHDIFH